MKLRNGALATGAVATLAALGLLVSVAGAQSTTPTPQSPADNSPHPIQIAGRVDKVDAAAKTLTLTAPRGSFTVTVSDKTWILAEKDGKCAEATLGDIKTDQAVRVAGMTTTLTATQVDARTVVQGACFAGKQAGGAIAPRRGAGPQGKLPANGMLGGAIADRAVEGTIKSISGGTVIVTSKRGDDVTVNTTADTVVLNGGFQAVSSLKVGDNVEVLGTPAGLPATKSARGQRPANPPAQKPARSIDAWGVRVVTDSSKLFVGVVDKVDGNTVTLKTRPAIGVQTITLDSSTGYKSATVTDRKLTLTGGALADIKAGSIIMVEGTPGADSTSVNAKAVVVLPNAPAKVNRNGVKP